MPYAMAPSSSEESVFDSSKDKSNGHKDKRREVAMEPEREKAHKRQVAQENVAAASEECLHREATVVSNDLFTHDRFGSARDKVLNS